MTFLEGVTIICRRKLGVGENWHPFKFERIGRTYDFLITGSEARSLTRGPRKGERTWRPMVNQLTCCVTDAEFEAEKQRGNHV